MPFRAYLSENIPSTLLDPSLLQGVYILNLIASPFAVNKAYAELIYNPHHLHGSRTFFASGMKNTGMPPNNGRGSPALRFPRCHPDPAVPNPHCNGENVMDIRSVSDIRNVILLE
ncbi:hypothetical protein BGW80DRAFT_245726 [Lactifluus volemus]|nr:hypothetical protein BGW80DRAFT_245726 [Lactifluus volemus]